MKKYAVIVAGGAGLRMGTTVPKQFLSLNDRPVLSYTLESFLKAYEDMEIVLVVAPAYLDMAGELVRGLAGAERVRLVGGGDTRFHSVRNGLGQILERLGAEGGTGEQAVIFVHDGVRCLVTPDLIQRCYEQTLRLGSAVPVVDCTDSVRLVEEEGSKPIDRSRIKLVQTPQTFRGDIILGAYLQDHQESFTDEATVVEESGRKVHLIEGEMTNIKITTAKDLTVARHILEIRAGR